MALARITSLPVATALEPEDKLVVNQDGIDKQADLSMVASGERVEYITAATVDVESNVTYYAENDVDPVVFVLPETFAKGRWFQVIGSGTAGFVIEQQDGQTFHLGNVASTTGVAGTVESTHYLDSFKAYCLLEDTDFTIVSTQGNLDLT